MRISKIKIKNFRCFKNIELNFGNRATILYGKNGSGKSTVINALHKALSFIMYSDKIYVNTKVGNKSKKKLLVNRTITQNNPYLKVEGFSKVGDFNNTNDPIIEIAAEAVLPEVIDLKWSMSAYSTNNRLRASEFREAFRSFYNWYQETDKLPLIAYYSDCFPHKEDNKKITVKKQISGLRNFAYFDWNAVEGCTKEWLKRLEDNIFTIQQNKLRILKLNEIIDASDETKPSDLLLIHLLQEKNKILQTELDFVERKLVQFSNSLNTSENDTFKIKGISFNVSEKRLSILNDCSDEISFINLPAGYKRLYSIVLDLAFRSYILNGKEADSTEGIVIIDEIDLHLHPELENIVLSKLMQEFPHIQFIVSTHSINVLTNLPTNNEENVIIKMPQLHDTNSEPDYKIDIYGLDPSIGMQEIMDVEKTFEELQTMIDRIAYMRIMGYTENADNLKKYIIDKKLISATELEKRIEGKEQRIN